MAAISPSIPTMSCLVISRQPQLLNRMLASLEQARRFWQPSDEVLCSWNGSSTDEERIEAPAHPTFRIASRTAYHFAANMNRLAEQALGELLVLVNDDVVLDPGCLDRAAQILETLPEVGLVGGRLRNSEGMLTHAGLLFANDGCPYNRFRPDQLGPLIDPDGLEVQESGPMPAVTGALMVIRRSDFLSLRFRETFRVCGEDVALCLDCWSHLGKTPYYASDVTAIHDEKSTRGDSLDHYDIQAVGRLVQDLANEHPELRAQFSHWAVQESALMWRLCQQLRGERDGARQQRDEQLKELRELLQEQQKEWHHDRTQLIQERDQARAEAIAAQQKIRDLLQSTSWKLTAPLRSISERLGARPTP
ncbi:glycosyltransferase [Synechococcus sp. RedBA-s]|uniref:glycosyltransferase family 2 protein n=1 Tax=Synechococcus sp. RedBA-s TaxID=2823741 RepID=UPI0020CD4E7B|nr:glycosyltransferase [Synechococcus sp. RedBA-s]MCP9799193.1 glycosyltransferase family 2 protein [Synechococcus sp. RedBA-s]